MATTCGCCASRRTRCRDILAKLTELSSSGEPFDRTPLTALIEEVVAPHRNFGVAIDVTRAGRSRAPSRSARAIRRSSTASAISWKMPSISRASGSMVDAQWSEDAIDVTISDDGPGFAPEIMDRIGEPYVTSRRRTPNDAGDEPAGLGLGFFIAKTLLERSGATLTLRKPRVPRSRRHHQRALAPRRIRAAVNDFAAA